MLFCRGGLTVYEKYHFKANRFSIVTTWTFKVALMIENRTWVSLFGQTYFWKLIYSNQKHRFDLIVFDRSNNYYSWKWDVWFRLLHIFKGVVRFSLKTMNCHIFGIWGWICVCIWIYINKYSILELFKATTKSHEKHLLYL